jgi:hypothetical protein
VQLASAGGAGPAVDIDDDLDPWQLRRQRAAIGASLLSPRGSLGRSRPICCRRIAHRHLLDVFKAEQHLIFGQRLGPAAKMVPLHFFDDLAKPLTLALLGQKHRFQHLKIVGHCVAWHERIRSYSRTICDSLDAANSLSSGIKISSAVSAPLFPAPHGRGASSAVQPFQQRRQLRGR